MNWQRMGAVMRLELAHNARRPIFWILLLILAFISHGLCSGHATISSGDTAVGGTRAWMTSEFSLGKIFCLTIITFYSFFMAVVAGMTIIRDDEMKVSELIHATPLKTGEYIWAKYLASLTSFLAVLVIHILFLIFFNHVFPMADAEEIRGPLDLVNYLRPALVFALPAIIFVTGTCFAFGEFTRRPILVFLVPVATLLAMDFFLWNWSPSWLDPRINHVLSFIDPSGLRWLSETWMKVDRGVDFYNSARIGLDAPFILSRVGFVGLGLASVVWSRRQFGRHLRGSSAVAGKGAGEIATMLEGTAAAPVPAPASAGTDFRTSISHLGERTGAPGFARSVWDITRVELGELRRQAGLYLFIPLIFVQTFFTATYAVGVMSTPLLLTPGNTAARCMNTLTLLICLLALFYTVESLQREKSTGMAPILYTTPTGTAAVMAAKALANSLVGVFVVITMMVACLIAIQVQGKVPLSLEPYALMWGLLLIPTFLVWTAFVTAVEAIVNNRYTAYGICLSALGITGYLQAIDKMNWVGNWNLWGAVRWSDMGIFELDRPALVLNRVMVLGLAAFLVALAVRVQSRRDRDAVRNADRWRPVHALRALLPLTPFMVVPVVAGVLLGTQVRQGFQGEVVKKEEKDYWKQNLITWREAPRPSLTAVEVDLEVDPDRRWLRSEGSYRMTNSGEKPLAQIPLTGGVHWEKTSWTMNGEEYEPEDRSLLYVFTPPTPLDPGEEITIGFSFEGEFPRGVSKNGGQVTEFILPSGVVLTSFNSSFVPFLGYDEERGVEKENRYEPRVYPEDFYRGITPPTHWAYSQFDTRVTITGPPEYTFNSVGVRVRDELVDGKRVVTWKSDRPVRFFNVVGGRWEERKGKNTAIYFHPDHPYNIDEMLEALDGAREFYSQWFLPFPWRELKLSEFPDMAGYAQGFPTNITFSEGIGFLTKSDPRTNTAFAITAHEAAHQWWGNILIPGEGPGGEILSEGMANYSAILLLEQEKGERARMEFCKRMEEHYGDARRADAERALVKIDGSKRGDETVTYDKGAWVFWMLTRLMGREQALAGIRRFVADYKDGPDYPVLQDFVAAVRPFAEDTLSFDRFIDQWFFDVVVPEYMLGDPEKTRADEAHPGSQWKVTLSVTNVGSGVMPVEVAAARGDRFAEDESPDTAYRDARVTVLLGPDEEAEVEIPCDFEPDRVLVDPDVLVLQLEREDALVRF